MTLKQAHKIKFPFVRNLWLVEHMSATKHLISVIYITTKLNLICSLMDVSFGNVMPLVSNLLVRWTLQSK